MRYSDKGKNRFTGFCRVVSDELAVSQTTPPFPFHLPRLHLLGEAFLGLRVKHVQLCQVVVVRGVEAGEALAEVVEESS